MANFFKIIFPFFRTQKIIWRTALWVWGIILLTITIFILNIIPFQTGTVLERMENESTDIASSIMHANSSALITDDYGLVVDHCLQLVSSSKSILYVVLTRRDRYSLVHVQNNWYETSNAIMWMPDTTQKPGEIVSSELVGQEVFHKSYKVEFSRIFWGWIHVGLSLNDYKTSIGKIKTNLTWLTIISSVIGLIISILLAQKLTKPITILNETTKKIADGDLSAKAIIKTNDELESLAISFNKMTDKLKEDRNLLEWRVKERTAALAETNDALIEEIQERKKVEESLKSSLQEKEVLLKEIHHRVKNNLQIITSLLFLQSRNIKDEEYLTAFQDCQNRVKTMALVHEKLYQSEKLSQINFGEYLINLVSNVNETYSLNEPGIKITYDLDEIYLTIDTAIPLGLIFNELLSNAMKYAFKSNAFSNGKEKLILIRIKNNDENIIVVFEDNGVGFPNDFNIEESETLGLKLISILINQLQGQLQIDNSSSTRFTITIKKYLMGSYEYRTN